MLPKEYHLNVSALSNLDSFYLSVFFIPFDISNSASSSATALINSHCFINPSHQICISLYLFHSICSTSTLWWLAGQIYHQGCIQNPSPFLLRQHYAIDILCHSIRFYLLGDTRIQLAHLLQSGYWLGTETYNIPYHPTRRVFLDVC